jgi:DNA (cytosine-5)-methyltransferase 1
MKRIAKGIEKFVLNNPNPFIIPIGYGEREGQAPRVNSIEQPLSTVVSSCKQYLVTPTLMANEFNNAGGAANEPLKTILTGNHHYLVAPVVSQIGQTGGGDRLHDIQEPLSTIVSKAEHILVAPSLIQYHSETAHSEHRGQTIDEPIMTLDSSNRYGLVAAFLSKYFAGGYTGAGAELTKPTPTVTAIDHNAIVTSHLLQLNNHCDGRDMSEPIPTIVAGPGHWGEVRTFLMSYYGNKDDIGQNIDEPLRTITSKDRFGIVFIHGKEILFKSGDERILKGRFFDGGKSCGRFLPFFLKQKGFAQ